MEKITKFENFDTWTTEWEVWIWGNIRVRNKKLLLPIFIPVATNITSEGLKQVRRNDYCNGNQDNTSITIYFILSKNFEIIWKNFRRLKFWFKPSFSDNHARKW